MNIKTISLRTICGTFLLFSWITALGQTDIPAGPDSIEQEKLEIQARIQQMMDQLKDIYNSSKMLPQTNKELNIKSSVVKAMNERLRMVDKDLKSLSFRWDTYFKTIQPVIVEDEQLMETADLFQQVNQATRDTLNNQIALVQQLLIFCKAESVIPSQMTAYQDMFEKAMSLSAVAQLAPQLEKLKGEEKMNFGKLQELYTKAQEATTAMPGLKKRMNAIDQNFITLKTYSQKIQEAEYKPFIQRIKDYLLGLAAVAIVLMFVNMIVSKIQAVKKTRESLKKVKDLMNGTDDSNCPTITLLPFVLFLFASCDNIPQILNEREQVDSLKVITLSQPEFSNNYKTIVINGRLGTGVGSLPITDTTAVRIDITETLHLLSKSKTTLAPKMVKVENVAAQELAKKRVKMLALVDLTLPQALVDQERKAVTEIRNLFSEKNFYVAFIDGYNISETMPASDYVLNNYFIASDSINKHLYRAIVNKMDEMSEGASWTADAHYKAMIIMSDGVTYNDNEPMDINHFELEHRITEMAVNSPLYYVNFSENDLGNDIPLGSDDLNFQEFSVDDDADTDILHSCCTTSKGLYLEHFDWPIIRGNIMGALGIDDIDFRFTLENPDHKVYRGRNGRDLIISCYDINTDSLIAKGLCHYSLGSIYSPVIVNPESLVRILIKGCVLTLILFLIIYVTLQFIIPYIQYRLFLKKHVLTYSSTQLSTDGDIVSQSCYLCKAPFIEGEKIVAKCKHTMHLDCWNENSYQCPEYGRHCKNGRHYYNKHNLFDWKNATFYLQWIIAAIFGGLAAWIAYTTQLRKIISGLLQGLILFVNNIEPNTTEATLFLNTYGTQVNHVPSFGFCIGFFLTLILSFMSVPHRDILSRLSEIAIRGILGGLGGLFIFFMGVVISLTFDLSDYQFLFDWIPWALTGYWLAICVTWGTRIPIRHSLVVSAFLLGIISTYLWSWLYTDSIVDYRVMLLASFHIFAIAMAIAIANVAPRSEHYFLTVSGIIKQIDIALYKWFKANPQGNVTIGHSVDCDLQLSWDIQSMVAPIQAEIRYVHGVLRLFPLEDGVFAGNKHIRPGKSIRLYHGRTFTIGKTTFTYIEKDQ